MSKRQFVNFIVDRQSLLLPQSDVHHVELVGEIRTGEQDDGGNSIGVVDYDRREWPVYALDAELLPVTTLPENSRLVACMVAGDHYLALACDAVATAQFESEYIYDELPEMMRTRGSPIRALLYAGDRLHYVIDTGSLIEFLSSGRS